MKFYFKTLSLLHIGSGNQLEIIDYVVIDDIFYKLGNHTFINFLEKNNLSKEYQKYSQEIYNQLEKAKQNEKQNEKRYELGLDVFCEKNKKFSILEDFLKNDNKVQKIPLKHKIDLKGNKVREQVRDGLQNPYIPGSSIKGAIRTALLYHWLNHYGNEKDILNLFDKDLKNNKKDKNFANDIECFAFYCKKEGQNSYDEKLDLMKLLQVSDGKIVQPEPVKSLIIAKPYLFLQTGEKQKQAVTMEAIQENVFIEWDIRFNVQFLFSLKNLIKDDAIIVEGKKQWIGIKTKCKQLFGLDIDALTSNNLIEKEKEVIRFILNKVKIFSEKQIKKHQAWKAKVNPNPQKKKNQQEFFNKQQLNFDFLPAEKNILHLGFGTGFIGTTEILYILENESLKEKFLEIMKKLKIGDKPGRKKDDKKEYKPTLEDLENAFPKSRLMYEEEVNGKNYIKPVGWVQIMDEKEYQEAINSAMNETVTGKKETYQPNYFKEKLKAGVIVEGQYVRKDLKNPKIKYFKLFIQEPGKEQEAPLNYSSDIEEGQYAKLTITNVDKNGKVTSITLKNFIK